MNKKLPKTYPIKNLDDLINQEFIFDIRYPRKYHIGWFQNWSLHYANQNLKYLRKQKGVNHGQR